MGLITPAFPRAALPAALLAGFPVDAAGPSLDYQFARDYSLYPRGRGPILTYTRVGNTTYFDSSGTLQTAAANVAPFDYNPTTLAPLGLSIWEARTNSIRNNTMVGAVAGSPGTPPTNWIVNAGTNAGTVTTNIIGTGTENGIAYIDMQLVGTPTGAGAPTWTFETAGGVAASNAQVWENSTYIRIVGGTVANLTFQLIIKERDAGTLLLSHISSNLTLSAAALNTQRRSYVATNTQAGTTNVVPSLQLSYAAAVITDITLRIGTPQLELVPSAGSTASPVIATAGAAATRALPAGPSTTDLTWMGATENTFVLSGVKAGVATAGVLFQLDDGTENNRITFSVDASANPRVTVVTGGVTQADINAGTAVANTAFKVAFRIKNNDIGVSFNGAASVVDSSTPNGLPTVTTLRKGNNSAGTAPWNGWNSALTAYPKGLVDAQLVSLAT